MIRAKNITISDRGFAVSAETIRGVSRQILTLELPTGITDEALEALCAGPIEVLDDHGEIVQTHEGPFRAVSHSLRLTRADAGSDVSALLSRVSDLEAELTHERSAKKSAQDALASLSARFDTLKASMDTLTGKATTGESAEAAKAVQADEAAGV